MRDQAIKTLQGLLTGIKFAMLTTVAEDGQPPQPPHGGAGVGVRRGPLVLHRGRRRQGGRGADRPPRHVVFADPNAQRYVSVSSLARVVRDPVQVRERWSPAYKSWFPKGVDDPSLALLRVTVTAAEYWESPSSPVVRIMGLAKAMATGQRPQPGQSTKLDLERSA